MSKNQQVGTKSKWTTVVSLLRTMVGVGKRMMRRLPSLLSRSLGIILKRSGFFGYDKETKEYTPDPQADPHLEKIIKERQPGKTFWDWLQLSSIILIPLVIFYATMRFNQQQADLAQKQYNSEQTIANQQHAADQQLAQDQQREATLKSYLDDMTTLLLDKKLGSQAAADKAASAEAAFVARERTLTTLRRLDAKRNGFLLRFLQDAHLIGIQDAVINLSNADLSNDDLSDAHLSGIDLSGAILNGADLSDADLSDAILNGAHLDGAHLDGAILNGAFLSDATLNGAFLNGTDLYDAILNSADLNGAHLSGAILYGADLSNATLSGADLSNATLSDAILNDAILNGAHLNDAILNGAHLNDAFLGGATLNRAFLGGATLNRADLSNATLSDAILYGADLSDARNLTQQQLDIVYSCTNADLSGTGLTCHHNRGGSRPSSSSSTVTLTYWYTEGTAETPVILHLIQQFQQQNPNIKINAVYKPFFQMQTAFVTAAQTGKTPDVLRSDVGWVTQFASQGYLLPIDSYVSQSDISDYLTAPLSYDQYNGHLYGLPQVTDFLALLYNKAELAQAGITSPPATMSDFEAAAMKIMQSEAAKYGFETTGTSYYVLPFLWAFGGGMIDQHNNNILVNNSGSVAGLTCLLKLQNADQVMPAKVDFSNGYTNMVNDFKNGETAMIFDGPWEVSNILTGSAFTGNSSNLGIAAIPRGPAGQTGSPVGGQSYVIYAGTAHPAEAYKFISFMSSTDSQVAIAQANHTLPTRNTAYQDPGVSSDPFISKFYAIRKTAVLRPQSGYLLDAFDPNIGATLDGAKSPTDALNAVADVWKQLVKGANVEQALTRNTSSLRGC